MEGGVIQHVKKYKDYFHFSISPFLPQTIAIAVLRTGLKISSLLVALRGLLSKIHWGWES